MALFSKKNLNKPDSYNDYLSLSPDRVSRHWKGEEVFLDVFYNGIDDTIKFFICEYEAKTGHIINSKAAKISLSDTTVLLKYVMKPYILPTLPTFRDIESSIDIIGHTRFITLSDKYGNNISYRFTNEEFEKLLKFVDYYIPF